jgi:hypothetical protein
VRLLRRVVRLALLLGSRIRDAGRAEGVNQVAVVEAATVTEAALVAERLQNH